MALQSQIDSFLKQASLTAQFKNRAVESVSIVATIITPVKQIQCMAVDHFAESADFIRMRSEKLGIKVKLQPGVYFDDIVPYRDDLTIQLMMITESETMIREYVAIPLVDRDVRSEGQLSSAANLRAYDNISFTVYEFQLMDRGFAKLRNIPVSFNYLMSNPGEILSLVMDKFSKSVDMGNGPRYKGLYMYKPIDNVNNYPQVAAPFGTRLVDLPAIFQNNDEYGIYSKGLSAFYKQNYWWIVPIFDVNRVNTHHRPIDIIRVPQDKIPSLDSTFYRSDISLTIIATGQGMQSDGADKRKQNDGVGKRVINGKAVSGETGYSYTKGRAVITRADTMQEYKLSDRRNGEEYVPLATSPSGNMCAALTTNASNEGEYVEVEWHNGDTGYLEPCHPVRYQYIGADGTIIVRRGVLIGYRSDWLPVSIGPQPELKRTCVLHLFLRRQDKYGKNS